MQHSTVREKPLISNHLSMSDYAAFRAAHLALAEINRDRLCFENSDGLSKAIQDGFFYLRIPSDLDVSAADAFCHRFYEKGNEVDYRSIKLDSPYQGYFDRPHDQWENLYLEAANWYLLPSAVSSVGRAMAGLGLKVLSSVLDDLKVPETLRPKVTGGLSRGHGHQMMAFNHYRPEKDMRGCKLHRDSGWVTVLRSTEPGLVRYHGGEYQKVLPKEGYFIINFGSTLEVLAQHHIPCVSSVVHGVVQTHPSTHDRTSYLIFLDSDLQSMVHQWVNGQAIPVQSMKDFAEQEVARTYDNENRL